MLVSGLRQTQESRMEAWSCAAFAVRANTQPGAMGAMTTCPCHMFDIWGLTVPKTETHFV